MLVWGLLSVAHCTESKQYQLAKEAEEKYEMKERLVQPYRFQNLKNKLDMIVYFEEENEQLAQHASELIANIESISKENEVSEEFGGRLASLLTSFSRPCKQLAVHALHLVVKEATQPLLTEEFLTRHNLVHSISMVLLTEALNPALAGHKRLAYKALVVLRNLCYRLTPHYLKVSSMLKRLYTINSGKDLRLATLCLTTAALIYPIEPANWSTAEILVGLVDGLEANDVKVQLLAFEGLHQLQGQALVNQFIQIGGLAILHKLMTDPERNSEVAAQACLLLVRLIGESHACYGKAIESDCMDALLVLAKSHNWEEQFAATSVLRLLSTMQDELAIMESLRCEPTLAVLFGVVSDHWAYTGHDADINPLMDCLETLLNVLKYSRIYDWDSDHRRLMATIREAIGAVLKDLEGHPLSPLSDAAVAVQLYTL